ncbi:uncharacterized protein BO66DRAFT_169136 [Aspergillus aculeatinus CBS 121060]|uniref:Uncharacterized protein n=1 Tax=Aspergillus aculeatinus CBS 121060 TaxID=1448322 RepID=A0ACD1GZT6_9EURO|nr:hypothetical protein BO66DRAFT_169136 [Aspergillus aculeatinus CBS 121060]RAH66866.1 hypothetical protein BO66DRAFT_169136 [Aspergillus aculeatinus CBS 121060]
MRRRIDRGDDRMGTDKNSEGGRRAETGRRCRAGREGMTRKMNIGLHLLALYTVLECGIYGVAWVKDYVGGH